MIYSSPLVLRRTIFSSRLIQSIPSTCTQARHARVLAAQSFSPSRSSRFLQTTSSDTKARILEKYKEKLERKMKAEGVSTYTDLREKYKSKIEEIKNDPTLPPLPKQLLEAEETPIPHQTIIPPPRPTTSSFSAPPGVKTLSSYLDLEKLRTLPSTEIEYLWRLRHASSDTSLCACIPTPTFHRLYTNARSHPMFILPLPRPGGAIEMHFLQWTIPHKDVVTVLFTSLAAYKLHGEFAVPHTTLTHHLELKDEKQVVLAQGGVVKDRGVSVEEGRWLVMALQKFYGADPEEAGGRVRIKLLESFTKGGEGFKVEDIIAESEKLR